MKAIMVGAAALTVASCATPGAGDDQQVAIFSVPSGATCEIWREGVVIARQLEVPEIVTIDQGPAEIEVVCVREGYAETRVLALIDREHAVVGNILIGEDIGSGIEGASGAGYPSIVYVELVRERHPFQGVFDGQPSTPFD